MKEDANRFNGLLAEQLREQVGNLMAAAQLLIPAIREQEDRKYDQYLAILNQSMYRLLRLTEHLEFTGGGDRPAARRETVELSALCGELCREVAPLARQCGVAFRKESGGREVLMEGDGVLLRRMLLNLIANALRAAGAGGSAGLRLSAENGRARITIWDDGQGEILPGAQDPAELALEERLKERSGLGLGLEIAREIAALHGGTLVYERGEDSRGIRAVVSLPVGEMCQTLKSPRMGYDPTGGFSQVLVELSEVLPYEVFLPDDVE